MELLIYNGEDEGELQELQNLFADAWTSVPYPPPQQFSPNCFILYSVNESMRLIGEAKRIVKRGRLLHLHFEKGDERIWEPD